MAVASMKRCSRGSLEIRTRSVEQTLIPLVTQITTLVNHKEKSKLSEKTLKALVRVGQAVHLAVERFVTVGASIGEENPEINDEICEACREAKQAGNCIQKITENDCLNGSQPKTFTEKTAMVRAARQLLSAITKVLLIADKVVVKQILVAKDKVLKSVSVLEGVTNFTDFVKAFSQFGNEMVELAHLTGDRQNDIKSDKQRAQMGSARAVLEKATMMLLTSSKTFIRQPGCEAARRNRDGVFQLMKISLDRIQQILTDSDNMIVDGSFSPNINGDSGIGLISSQVTASKAFKDLEDQIEVTRVTHVNHAAEEKLRSALETMIETSQEFTDSAYTSHENREKILAICDKLREELDLLIGIGFVMNQKDNNNKTEELETAVIKTVDVLRSLKKQLLETAMDQASDLFKSNEDHEILMAMKSAGLSGDPTQAEEISVKFQEHTDQLEEVCKLFRHMATTDPLVITAEHNESVLKTIGPLILYAAQTLAQYPGSKIARENLDVFSDAWESQINDLSVLVKEVNDVCSGRLDKYVYLSLPRPGTFSPKHGTTPKSLKPAKLDAEEQAKIAKLGLEMKLITSEMDAETDKWEEADNEIVKRAKNMSSMAFSMYLFTRGEGPLKTTQDLFVQAEYFAEEGNKLYKSVREFGTRVPMCQHKDELVSHVDKIPIYCHQLQTTLKSPTIGKTATFNKVDSAIQETKNLMNSIAKVVTTCFICATKYNIDYRTSPAVLRKQRPELRTNGSDSELIISSQYDSNFRSAQIIDQRPKISSTSSLERT